VASFAIKGAKRFFVCTSKEMSEKARLSTFVIETKVGKNSRPVFQ
jgi:hypothetical protein